MTNIILVFADVKGNQGVQNAIGLVILLKIMMPASKWQTVQRKRMLPQRLCFMVIILLQLHKINHCGLLTVLCSNPMTSQEALLINLDSAMTCNVKMGTGDLVRAIGNGTFMVETKHGKRYIGSVVGS